MAIGDFGSNNSSNRNTIWNPTCYSRYRFKNDNLSLDTSFNNGLMKMEINEFADGKPVPKIAIYLSPIKALLLAEQIVSFVDYRDNTKKIDTKVAFGVNAGMGEKVTYIGFSTDEDKKNYITIGKFNGEGVIIESYKFQLQQDYHYALDWTNIESNEINKNYKNDMELTMIKNMLVDFGRSMSGANAYSYMDANRYEANRASGRIDLILDKLGIDRKSNYSGSSNYNSSNNFLNNAQGSASKSTSIDDIEDYLMS